MFWYGPNLCELVHRGLQQSNCFLCLISLLLKQTQLLFHLQCPRLSLFYRQLQLRNTDTWLSLNKATAAWWGSRSTTNHSENRQWVRKNWRLPFLFCAVAPCIVGIVMFYTCPKTAGIPFLSLSSVTGSAEGGWSSPVIQSKGFVNHFKKCKQYSKY